MKPMLPREHGSWAVLIAPIIAGFAAADARPSLVMLLFSFAALGAFLLRPPLQALVSQKAERRAWPSLVLYGLLALAGLAPLLLAYDRWGLVGFAVPAAGVLSVDLIVRRGRRSLSAASEISGIMILCLGAPAAFYAARGTLSAQAWWVWLLSALFFAGPVFHVKLAALQHRASAGPLWARELPRMSLISNAYHCAALAAVIVMAARGAVPAAAVLPFALALAKTWRRAVMPPSRVDFRRLGYQEVGYSAVFALTVATSYVLI